MSGLLKPSTSLWYVHFQGRQLGPYSWDQVAKYYADCQLPLDFLVWTKGMIQWQAMSADLLEPINADVPAQPSSSQRIELRDKPRLDANAKAGVRSTGRAIATTETLDLAAPLENRPSQAQAKKPVVVVAQQEAVSPESTELEKASANMSNEASNDGWVNADIAAKPPVTEPEKPLDEQFAYRMPQVKPKPPLYITLILMAACILTYALHRPGFQIPTPKSPFTLRCSYRVDALGSSSIRQPVRVQVAGKKFRASSPQILKDFVLFDGNKLTVFATIPAARKTTRYRKTVHSPPNPKLMSDVMLWTPRLAGEPVGTAKVAKRLASKLTEISRMGSYKTQIEEWIDVEQGIVLKRLETTSDATSVIERKVFQCSRLDIGPIKRGAFKEPR